MPLADQTGWCREHAALERSLARGAPTSTQTCELLCLLSHLHTLAASYPLWVLKPPSADQVRAIDLRSSHPRIEQMDFFDLRPEGTFGAVVCSMARDTLHPRPC